MSLTLKIEDTDNKLGFEKEISLGQAGKIISFLDVIEDINPSLGVEKTETKKKVSSRRNQTHHGGLVADISDTIKSWEVVPQMEGYVGFHDLKTKGDKILWIVIYSQNKGMESLSSAEISFIADRLMENIPVKSISGLTEINRKKGLLVYTQGRFKVYKPAMDYLKNIGS